jgi:hypothetical protein
MAAIFRGLQNLHGLNGVGRRADRIAMLAQKPLQQQPYALIVINNQKVKGHCAKD